MMEAHLDIKPTPSLCFDREDFLKESFSPDKFVSHYRKYATLETMKDDLSMYHKILCAAMIQLINKDYADFVNLSSNLVGLDKVINSLTLPLQSFKNEVDKIRKSLSESLQTAVGLFSKRRTHHKMKVLTQHVSCFIESLQKVEYLNPGTGYQELPLELENLKKLSLLFNAIKFHFCKLSEFKTFAYEIEVVRDVHQNIQVRLQKVFLRCLPFDDLQYLSEVLHTCRIISAEREMEECFVHFAVRPFMERVFTQPAIVRYGLPKLYDEVLDFIQIVCRNLLKVTEGTNRQIAIGSGNAFLLNCVWPEIINSLSHITYEHLYSLGSPEQFVENYNASTEFLEKFESHLIAQDGISMFHELASYKEFFAKYNLELYFEIRFQEISGQFEESLLGEGLTASSDETCGFMLMASCGLYTSLAICWDKTVVLLEPLKYQFLKLTFQLLSRFVNWAYSTLDKINDVESCPQIAMLIADVEHLFCEINTLYLEMIYPEFYSGRFSVAKDVNDIKENFYESLKRLHDIIPTAETLLLELLIGKSSLMLNNISTIPQKFRKTHRVPDKPSPYLSKLNIPLMMFVMNSSSVLSTQWIENIKRKVIDGVIRRCTVTMRDVLISIRRMEESLRNLRKARDKQGSDQLPVVTTVTDDDKIRRQLAIDVEYLKVGITKELQFDICDMQSYIELKELIHSAEMGLPI